MPMAFGDDYLYAFIWQGNPMYAPLTEDAVKVASFRDLLTSQIAQLQQMTDTLKDINHTVQSNETKVIDAMSKFEEIKGSVKSCDENSKIILDTISDILSYVKTSQTCNQEILFKVNLLEQKLITADTKLSEQQ